VRAYLALYLLCLLLLSPATPVAAVGLPAGTALEVVANASCVDSEGQTRVVDPASVTLTVIQVVGVNVASVGQSAQATPGQDFYIPVHITNTGNGPDTFNLATASAKGWNTAVVYDDNADGVHQSDEQWVITSAGLMVADGYSPCFVRVSVPADATANDTVTLSAVSQLSAAGNDQVQIPVSLPTTPSVSFTGPTGNSTLTVSTPTIDIVGTATCGLSISKVEWATDHSTSGVCSGTTSWSATGVGLQLGSNVITVTATDSAGRTGTDVLTVTYQDATAPSVSITAPTSAATYTIAANQIAISGSASDNVAVSLVSWSNNRGGSGSCTGTATWSAGSIPLVIGQNVITVTARDAQGQSGTDVLTVTYQDATAPAVTISTPTSAATYTTNTSQITISGSASDNVAVTSVSWSNNRGGSGSCTGTATWSAGSVPLVIGENVITVTARDAQGETGTDLLTVTYQDAEAPVVTVSTPTSAGSYTTNTNQISISGSASDNVAVTSVSWSNNRGGSGSCTGTATWSAGSIPLVIGQNVITVTAADAQGQTGTDVLTVTYQDATAPVVTISTPTSAGTYTTNTGQVTISGSASDNVGVASVSWSNNRGGSGDCTGTATWSAGSIPLVIGQNVITVTARDAQGEIGTDVLTVTYQDAEAPVVAISTPTSAGTYTTNTGQVTVSGSASDNVGVTSVSWSNNRGGSGDCTGTATWSAGSIPLAIGQNVITVTATDAEGYLGTSALTVTYQDAEAPVVTVTGPTSAGSYTTNTGQVTVSGSASDNVGVTTVSWSNNRGGSGTCSGTSMWSAGSVPLAIGQNVITVTATDAEGHLGTGALTVTYQDAQAPVVTVTGPTSAGGYATSTGQVTVSGSASDNVGVTSVSWSNNRGGSGNCTGATDWSTGSIALAIGQNVITVTATDAEGHTGTGVLAVTYQDAESPVVSIILPTTAGSYSTNSSQLTVSGSASDNVGVSSVSWSNSRGGSGTCAGTTAWSTGSLNLSMGQNVITVTATDAEGHSGTGVLTINYQDADAPVVSIAAPTTAGTYTTDSGELAISGSASDNVGVSSVSWSNSRGGSGTCTGTSAWSAASISLVSGENVITVSASDAGGNSGTATLTVTYSQPDQKPAIILSSPTTGSSYTANQKTLDIAGSVNFSGTIASVSWSNNRGGSGTCTGTTSWSVAGIALRSGSNVITIAAAPSSGEAASRTLTVTCTADTMLPTVAIVMPTTRSTYNASDATVNLSGIATDNTNISAVTWSSNRGGSGACTGTTSWTARGVALSEGQNIITVTASDPSGNEGSRVLTVDYDPDATDPVIHITTPTSDITCARNCPTLILGGTATDNSSLAGVTWSNATTGASGNCTLSGSNWSATGISLQLGDNVITARASDASGNTADAALTVRYIDTTPGDAWAGTAMVSLPIVPDETDPKLAAGFVENSWCAYMTAEQAYAVYPDLDAWLQPADATPGRGFWASFDDLAEVPYGTIPAQDEPATIHLKAGWNLIGTPFVSEITWDASRIQVQKAGSAARALRDADDLTPGYAWGWRQDATDPSIGEYYFVGDPSIYAGVENTLLPWRAYWIRALAECDLIIPAPGA